MNKRGYTAKMRWFGTKRKLFTFIADTEFDTTNKTGTFDWSKRIQVKSKSKPSAWYLLLLRLTNSFMIPAMAVTEVFNVFSVREGIVAFCAVGRPVCSFCSPLLAHLITLTRTESALSSRASLQTTTGPASKMPSSAQTSPGWRDKKFHTSRNAIFLIHGKSLVSPWPPWWREKPERQSSPGACTSRRVWQSPARAQLALRL